MPASEDGPAPPLDADLREAFDAYRSDSNTANWNRLSQLYVGEIQVIDALQTLDPAFPDPYPLAAADLAGPDFLEWPVLPDPGTVLTAVLAALSRGDHP
jgi:hypothetical protein